MTLSVTLSDKVAEHLASVAKATSRTPEQVAADMIERNLAWQRTEESLAPVRAAFEASDMTEDELSDLVDAEIHAMRRERRAAEGTSTDRQ
jgi:predicted transcriptional regulator